MSTQVIVKAQGIVTEPNKVGQFAPGACRSIVNCAIRSFGELQSIQRWRTTTYYASSLPVTADGGAYALSEDRLSVFLKETSTHNWRLAVIDGLSGLSTEVTIAASPYGTMIASTGRTGIILFRNRLIICGTIRSFAYDIFPNPSSAPTVVGPRDCGLYQPSVFGRNNAGNDGTGTKSYFIAGTHFCGTMVLKNTHSDGYELISPPAFPVDIPNISGVNQCGSLWGVYSQVTSGAIPSQHLYEVQVYRTRSQSNGYDGTSNTYTPVACGSSFYLAKKIDRTGNNQSNILDVALQNNLGEALYTNNAVQGAAAVAYPPPSAKCAASFKGHVFYANRFDPAAVTLITPYYWGNNSDALSNPNFSRYMIGARQYTSQTSTNGSPNVFGFFFDGIVTGQQAYVYNHSTGALVGNGLIINFITGGTKPTNAIVLDSNCTFTGTVDVEIDDLLELNGAVYNVAFGADFFSRQVTANTTGLMMDITAVAVEPQTSNVQAGVYPDSAPTGGTFIRMRTNDPITLRATNGSNYSPELPGIHSIVKTIPGKQQENAFSWSENNQPEYVPTANYAFCGQGEIRQIIDTRDGLWFWCSDGLYRLSGTGGSVGDGYDWAIDPVDPNITLCYPNACVQHREYIYAHTSRGFVAVSSEGIIRELSDGRVNNSVSDNLFTEPVLENRPWRESNVVASSGDPGAGPNVWVRADVRNDDVLIRSPIIGDINSTIFAYNTKTDSFVVRNPSALNNSDPPVVATYNTYSQKLYSLAGDTGIIMSDDGFGFETMTFQIQPLYGRTAPESAYTKKHWQDVNFSFRPPVRAVIQVYVQFGDLVNGFQPLQNRTLPINYANIMPESSRVGFSVPRGAPALANTLAFSVTITGMDSIGTAAGALTLEGFQVSYVDFSDERLQR